MAPASDASLAPAAGASSPIGGAAPTPAASPSVLDDIEDAPARVIQGGASYDRFGSSIAAIGDLNADGADELAIVSRSPSAVTIVVGARGQAGSGTLIVMRPAAASDTIGIAVGGGGDLNGDGFDDFAVTVSRPGPGGTPVQEVQVYFGKSGYPRDLLRLTLSAPSLPSSFGSGLEVLPDMNGDGFADLVVGAARTASPAAAGAVFVYRGSATGVGPDPSWSYAAPDMDNAFGAAVFDTGDLNGDGLSDFVVTTGGAPGADGYARIYHFFGDATGSPTGPSVATGEQRDDGFGASIAGGDFNGDGYGDVLVGAPEFDASPESVDAGRLAEYRGNGRSLTTPSLRTGAPGAHYATSVANVGDLNGDGIDDAAVGAPMASAGGPYTNGQVFVYFGTLAGLATRYDMTEVGAAGYDFYGIVIASESDLDDDGRADLSLCAPGRDATGFVDAGACYIYNGLRIRLPAVGVTSLVAPDLTDGVALARAETPYHFVFTFVHRGPEPMLQSAEEVFSSPSGRYGVSVRYDGGSHAVTLAPDPESLAPATSVAELMADSSYAPGTTWVHSFQLYASVKFAWGLADDDALTVRLTVRDQRGGESSFSVVDAVPLIASLEFRSQVEARRADGTLLASGAYVRAGEALTFSGGALAYTGTHVPPPAAEISMYVIDAAGAATRASYAADTGDLYAQQPAALVDAPADAHRAEARVAGGVVMATSTSTVAVDALTPGFGSSTPTDNEVVTEANFPVSIHLFDSGSGVDGARVEYSVSHTNPPVFNVWAPAAAGTGRQVVATAMVALDEESYNFVQFRAFDRVGNGPAMSEPLRLQLDYGAVEFALVAPTAGTWVRDTSPTVTFSVRKATDPAVDLGTLEVQVNGASGGGWTSVGLGGSSLDATFATRLQLNEGPANEVRVRARLQGHDAVYVSAPFHIDVDTQLPTVELMSPAPNTWVTGETALSVVRVSDASSGPARATIQFRYYLPGAEGAWSPWQTAEVEPYGNEAIARAHVPVLDGTENYVVWQAQDAAGNGPAASLVQRLHVDTQPVTFGAASPADGAVVESVSRISIEVDDGDGSGVDLSTVEYNVLFGSGESTGWTKAGRGGVSVATHALVSAPIALPDGVATVQWRARDVAGTGVQVSPSSHLTIAPPQPISRPPRLVLTSPLSGAHYRAGTDVHFDAGRSFDPDGAPLFFQWSIDGEPQSTHAGAFWAQLAPGRHTVTLIVSDGTESPDITIAFTVDPAPAAPGWLASVAAQGMLVSFVLLLAASVGVRVWVRRARRALAA